MNYTQNLRLPQFDGSDRIHHDDFNEAFDKIDEALAGGVKIATGSYMGTGSTGANNPCSLTFDFAPKLIFVASATCNSSNPKIFPLIGINGVSHTCRQVGYTSGSTYKCTWTFSGNTVSWYSDNGVEGQMNYSGERYVYVAFG